MHRNTYLVVSILAVLAALVVGVNVGKKISPLAKPDPAPQDTPTPSPTLQMQFFTNTACGFSLLYPSTLTLLDNASGSAILNNTNDKSQTVVMTCQKDIPQPALPPEKIESWFLPSTTGASVSAKLYHDTNAKTGAPIDALTFTHPTRKLGVFVAGYGDAYNEIIRTIQVLP